MQDILQTAANSIIGFVIVLGFLVFIHEAGHFFAAKLFGVRVLVFSFGFGKRLLGFRRGDTDYRVSLIPLGGYVRMAGDIPEDVVSGEVDGSVRTGAPDEFLSKPKWQRLLILFAGPFMNLFIAVLFLAILAMVPTEFLVLRNVVGTVAPNKPGARAGLQTGDVIVKIGDEPINDFDDMKLAISMHAGTPLRIEYLRNGVRRVTTLTPERAQSEYGPIGLAGITPYYDPIVGRVIPNSPAAKAGLRTGDRIVAVNGQPVTSFEPVSIAFEKSNGGAISLDLVRGTQRYHANLPAIGKPDQTSYRGFLPPTAVRKLALIPAIKDSFEQNRKILKYAFISIGRMFRSEGSVKELSGPISIARFAGKTLALGWKQLMSLMAMISLQLGVLNLLPVPVLDGGHIFILLIEGAARRDLSLRVKERVQQIGFAALATLMLVVLYNDVISNFMRMRTSAAPRTETSGTAAPK